MTAAVGCVSVAVLAIGCGFTLWMWGVGATFTHGMAVTEVSESAATVWGRCPEGSYLRIGLRDLAGGAERTAERWVDATTDFTAALHFDGLAPATAYEAVGWCGHMRSATRARFRTAPRADDPAPVRFAWGGDVGGQNVCRDRVLGYPIFLPIRERQPDFFVALGDMIYADDACLAQGRYGNAQIPGPPAPAVDLDGFRAAWRYNRADGHLQGLLGATPMLAVWDDHEIRNDAGPSQDTLAGHPGRHLLPPARRAFLEYSAVLPDPDRPGPLYRSRRWGRHLELFLLDTRSHRDANAAADRPDRPKSMLGAEQRDWFLRSVSLSDATWKVVVSSVPLAIPTGSPETGRDGWANFDSAGGFENELLGLLAELRARGIGNLLWITTDVHFGSVLRYQPFAEDRDFVFHELVTGPLHAGVFPSRDLDPTLRPERLFFFGPEGADDIASFSEAQRWFNFGWIEIDRDGRLVFEMVNGVGETVFRLPLDPRSTVPGPALGGTSSARVGP